MLIEVTQADIDKANELMSATSEPVSSICPVAIAAKRAMNQRVVVGTTCIFDERTFNKCIVLPLAAKEFVENFDSGFEVKPFTFEVQSWD